MTEQREDSTLSMGKKLQLLRRQHGMNQEQLAEKLQVSRQLVSLWEQDKLVPNEEKMAELCTLYEISLERLLVSGKKEKPQTPVGVLISCIEKGEKSAKARKLTIQLALAAVVCSAAVSQILGLGIVLSIAAFYYSRKWKVNAWWLNLVILACMLFSALVVFMILCHTVIDFGYSTVTPLQ